MMDQIVMNKGAKKSFFQKLALSLVLMLLLSVVRIPLAPVQASAEPQTFELTLTQSEPENGFMMTPGAAISQDVAVNLGGNTGNCYVYVQITEKNNGSDYLTYQVAEGWSALLSPEGAPVPGVYYRYHESADADSWPVMENQVITVNPDTVTDAVLSQLASDPSGETWPSLTYEAYGIAIEEGDTEVNPYDGWCIVTGSDWRLVYSLMTPDPAIVGALNIPDELNTEAYDVYLENENGLHMQPNGTVQVKLPIAEEATDAVVLHVLSGSAQILNVIEEGNALVLQTGEDRVEVLEIMDAEVIDGQAVFNASSFSPYYVVSGHGDALKNWWETTQTIRYNFDSTVYGLPAGETGSREFIVEPNSSFYLYLYNTGAEKIPVTGTWTIESDNTEGRIMITTAGDGVGRVITVSADATSSDMLVFKANNWTITVRVKEDVVADAYDNDSYPVYIGITLDASTISIGNEPRVSGYDNNAWVYVTAINGSNVTVNGSSGAYEQYKTVAPVAGSTGADYLDESIKTVQMIENTDDKHVRGIIDNSLDTTENGAIDIDPYIRNIDWAAVKAVLLADSSVASQLKATDGVAVNSNQNNYVLQPYVVKIQTGNFIGWHINACFVPVTSSDGWVYFDENLDEALGQEVEFLNVPARRPWNGGKGTTASMYTVDPKGPGSNYVKISKSEYVTLTNGQKLRFMGWNTKPDGSGDMYSGEGGVFDAPNSKTEHTLVANGTLYAYWDGTLDRLEIHKDLLIDAGQDASGRYKTDFTFTVKLTLPADLEIDSNTKIIAEEFYVADDSLVANSQQSIGLQGTQKEYTITFTFNEDQYGVIYAPKGTAYTVTETLPSGNDYKLINAVNTEGTIGGVGEGNDVRFTNGWKNTTGMLDVSKTVVIPEGITVADWKTQEFAIDIAFEFVDGQKDFTYQLYDSQTKPVGDPVTVAPEEGTTVKAYLMHGERIIFSGLKEGTAYTVTETLTEAQAKYTPSVNNVTGNTGSGTIVANETQTVVFTNTHREDEGKLEVSKTVVIPEGITVENWESEEFAFTITFANVQQPFTYLLSTQPNPETVPVLTPDENGNVTFSIGLKHGESILFSGLKEGTEYTVIENLTEGSLFTPDESVKTGTIQASVTQEAGFVNRIVETNGTLTITKAFNGCTPESGESFVFTVLDANHAEVAEVVIYGAGSKTLSLPYGDYTVTEDDAWSWRYEASASPAQPVTVSSTSNPTVTFTNTREKHNWLDGSAGATNDFGSGSVVEHGGEQ